jgi:hypothetical protein
MNRMPSDKECTCDREMSDVDTIEFIIVGSRIELQCKKCIGIIGWWDDSAKKVLPSRRALSQEERLAMR